MGDKSILVTGGCGYIGSHTVLRLSQAGMNPVIVDNLTTGFENAILNEEPFYRGSFGDSKLLERVLIDHNVDVIIHFAASAVVPESVDHPLRYYENNVSNTIRMLEVAKRQGVKNIIFSSTAAVYGNVMSKSVSEDAPLSPESPYGRSKLMCESIIQDAARAHGLNYIILRYFNVAGADPSGRLGQQTKNATHLIKVLCEVLVGMRNHLKVFGDDYDTVDGTAIRDYIHVADLAEAHVLAAQRARQGQIQECFNCGYGRGYSVMQVIEAAKQIVKADVAFEVCPRRPGDVEQVVADNQKILRGLGWVPKHDKLEEIIESAYRWEKRMSAL